MIYLVLYSDDLAQTWYVGGSVTAGNECQAVELADGKILLNQRGSGASIRQVAGH